MSDTRLRSLLNTTPELSDNKLAHIRAVAEKMRNLALERGWGQEAADDAYLLGFLHDIGYAIDPAHHSDSAADLLERNGYRFADQVRYHGRPIDELSDILRLLWEADLTTGPDGADISIEERLEDVGSRYGTTSHQYRNAAQIAALLKERL